jgi:hypothetical protein
MNERQLSPQDWQLISLYLDGQLYGRDKVSFEQRLQSQPELKAGLEDLRWTRSMLQTAPRRRAPRNFTLTPEMAAKARPGFWLRFAPRLFGYSSALAAVLVAASMALQFFMPYSAPMSAPAQDQASMEMALATSAEGASMDQQKSTEPPMIINWGSGGYGMGGASGKGGGYGGGGADTGLAAAEPLANAEAKALPETQMDSTSSGEPTAEVPPMVGNPLAPMAVSPQTAGEAASTGTTQAPASTSEPIPAVEPTPAPMATAAPTEIAGLAEAPQTTRAMPSSSAGHSNGPILGIQPTVEGGQVFMPMAATETYKTEKSDSSWPALNLGLFALAGISGMVAIISGLGWWLSRRKM